MAVLLFLSVCLCFLSPVKTYATDNETVVEDTNLFSVDINKTEKLKSNLLEKYDVAFTKTLKEKLNAAISAMEYATSQEEYDNAKKDYSEVKSIVKKKLSKINSYAKKYTNNKSIMSAEQKKSYKNYQDKLLAASTTKKVTAYCGKMDNIIAKAKEGQWHGYVQVSCYGPYEGETITATSKRITNGTYYIAVPMERIVSYSSWKKMSSNNKLKHFYYGETIYLKKGSNIVKATVEDCGGFGGCGTTYNGKWCERLFDLTPAVFNALGVNSTGLVKWHY